MNSSDQYWMKRCLALAKRALGNTQPNPLVGAVVLNKQGQKVSEGFHKKAGSDHAELAALNKAGSQAKGGTLYVSLEPCCFYGKTPPCTDSIVKSEVIRVVIAMRDPNPKVGGEGIRILRQHGIKVTQGVCEKEAQSLNAPFSHWIQTGKPLVTAKVALSKDGKMGLIGKQIGLSGKQCLQTTMRLRAESGAIIVGVGTVLCDDPQLTYRGSRNRSPLKIIIDPHLRTPISSQVFEEGKTVLYTHCQDQKKIQSIKEVRGEMLWEKKETYGFTSLLKHLGAMNITAVLVEGGSKTFQGAYQEAVIDRFVVYETPVNLSSKFNDLGLVDFPLEAPFRKQFKCAIRRGQDTEKWYY